MSKPPRTLQELYCSDDLQDCTMYNGSFGYRNTENAISENYWTVAFVSLVFRRTDDDCHPSSHWRPSPDRSAYLGSWKLDDSGSTPVKT